MGKRRKISGQELLERLQGQGNQNDRQNFQDPPQPNVNNQMHDQMANVDITNNSIENATFDSSSFPNETVSQQKRSLYLSKLEVKVTLSSFLSNLLVAQIRHILTFLHEYNVRHFYWRNYNPKNGSKTSLAFGKDKESYGGNWW
jgi:hypothetical protein